MLAEAKASNALAGKGGLDGFSNEDLSKAIVEMQQLRKQQEAADGTVAGKETLVSEDGYQIVKLIIPPGMLRVSMCHVRYPAARLLTHPGASHLFLKLNTLPRTAPW